MDAPRQSPTHSKRMYQTVLMPLVFVSSNTYRRSSVVLYNNIQYLSQFGGIKVVDGVKSSVRQRCSVIGGASIFWCHIVLNQERDLRV